MNNYIQKIVEDFDFNSIHDDNNKACSFAVNALGLVDLGLPSGLLWCECNLGANTETEYGDYYAWGELTTKNEYTVDNYTYKDEPLLLPPERDAATQKLGKNYSIPTREQFYELLEHTDNGWVKNYNGTSVNGWLFISKINGNSIFIPAAGFHRDSPKLKDDNSYGGVWSSSLYEDDHKYTWYLYFHSSSASVYGSSHYSGRSIRPVFKK